MADKIVILNYGASTLTVDPPSIEVQKGESIAFQLGIGPTDGKVHITFHEPDFFSKPSYSGGDDDIVVIVDLPHSTKYDCDLLLNGVSIEPKQRQGGGIDPAKGKGG